MLLIPAIKVWRNEHRMCNRHIRLKRNTNLHRKLVLIWISFRSNRLFTWELRMKMYRIHRFWVSVPLIAVYQNIKIPTKSLSERQKYRLIFQHSTENILLLASGIFRPIVCIFEFGCINKLHNWKVKQPAYCHTRSRSILCGRLLQFLITCTLCLWWYLIQSCVFWCMLHA